MVIASGAYQKPHRPATASQIPASCCPQIDAENYTNPHSIPPGPVLIVGSGQTGCQLAEELYEAGRETYLACGRAPWMHRRLAGRDIIAWLLETPFMDHTLAHLQNQSWRLLANFQASGGRGGHSLNYRTLQALGVKLLGHFIGFQDGFAHFAPDLAESVAFGDARFFDMRGLIQESCKARGIKPPEIPAPPPFVADAPDRLDLRAFGAIIFTSGFRPDYSRWVRIPGAFDEHGFPIQKDGSSTVVQGLHFMGVHFQRKRKSATLYGAAEDATVLAESIVDHDRRGVPHRSRHL